MTRSRCVRPRCSTTAERVGGRARTGESASCLRLVHDHGAHERSMHSPLLARRSRPHHALPAPASLPQSVFLDYAAALVSHTSSISGLPLRHDPVIAGWQLADGLAHPGYPASEPLLVRAWPHADRCACEESVGHSIHTHVHAMRACSSARLCCMMCAHVPSSVSCNRRDLLPAGVAAPGRHLPAHQGTAPAAAGGL